MRTVTIRHIAGCVLAINACGIFMVAIGQVGTETLAAALYWPWVTFVIVALTASKRK